MLEEIRSLIRAESYRPFTLVLTDGRRLPVEKPYYLGISPTNRFLVYSMEDGGFMRVAIADVKDVDFHVQPRPGGIHEKRETA